ncbi:helix-turn-helix transcriptional regulator [Megamonas sp.]|uniref:helix-turn-helix domain-containing protein n=1 Tax=Megamonas sp. TaxID=2049033 RepID=UPI00257A9DCC|nr:helix-turn-helix transcriptional regulator [Megamonas sp.]MBS5780851.1 helix-turn-helix transcriptional regulator [Megamonas sp.]
MESFKPILEKIKKIKQEKGYTNEVLAQKSGIPLSTLNKILSSVIKDPKIGTLIAITDALDVDINSLIYDNLNIKNKPNPKATDNLEKLANEYNLNLDDISFITKYINLAAKDRQHFLSLLRLLTSKNIDNSPVLTKPDHKLTIEEKRKIVEYELYLEEKKQTLLASISSNGS